MILPPACTATTSADNNVGCRSNGNKSYAADQSVNCVAFHPSSFTNNNNESSSSADADEIYNNPCMVYITSSNRMYGYDIRQYTTPIITTATSAAVSSRTIPTIKTPNVDLTSTFHCIDEINQLSFSYPNIATSNNSLCMSTVDDSGEARVVFNYDPYNNNDLSQNNTTTTTMVLPHAKPETLSIASCGAFRPKQQYSGKKKKSNNTNNDGTSYLATAGTDCTIKLWDIDVISNNNGSSSNNNNNGSNRSNSTVGIRHRPPTSTITFGPHDDDNNDDNVTAATTTTTTLTTMKLCNPPYIHSLSWSISGKYLAAGVGDGSIAIIRAEGHRLVKVARFRNSSSNNSSNIEMEGGEGHTSAVAAVHFPYFEHIVARTSDDDDADETMSKLNIKNRDTSTMNKEDGLLISAGNDGNIIFWDIGHKDKANMSLSIPSNKTSEQTTRIGGAVRQSLLSPNILLRIWHGHKPNWITSSRASDAALPNSIFVADTTNSISVYTLPM
jgi:hypothetical protein